MGGITDTPLPYDGMTRTGSKGLSQPHRIWCGTPNVDAQITGFTGYRQEPPTNVTYLLPSVLRFIRLSRRVEARIQQKPFSCSPNHDNLHYLRSAMNENKSLLLIDDSRVSRMKLRQLILQKYPDWKISEAASAEEGLQKVAEASPDLITLDINMPGMGGLAAIDQLRATSPQTVIVLLSGNVQGGSKRKADDLGVQFVEKPVTEASVAKVLACIDC
jgi:two-component system chemotaxis response regulator CheY